MRDYLERSSPFFHATNESIDLAEKFLEMCKNKELNIVNPSIELINAYIKNKSVI
jgi:hypothetical protein